MLRSDLSLVPSSSSVSSKTVLQLVLRVRLRHKGADRCDALSTLQLLALLLQVQQHVVTDGLRLCQRTVPLFQARHAAVQRVAALQQLLPETRT